MKPEDLKKYYIKTYPELYRVIDNRMRMTATPSTRVKDPIYLLKLTLLAKLGTTYNILVKELSRIIELLDHIDNMHRFYRELFILDTGKKPSDYKRIVKKMIVNASKIYREYRRMIREAEYKREIVKVFKAGVGRLLSIYKRKEKTLLAIKHCIKELSKLPDITGDYIVVIAGVPQVGKSTLLSILTRAKPKISPFPFTTKNVIVGHIDVEPYGKITLIDTPGILDRPIDKMNLIEYRAVLAVKNLADLVLYLFDLNPQAYYTFETQLNVYRSISELIGSDKILLIINKIDITSQDILDEKKKYFIREYGIEPLMISARNGVNIDYLKKVLIEKFMEKNQGFQQ